MNFESNITTNSESDEQIITLHVAKCIINEHCFIFKDEVINHIDIGNIVRISFTVATDLDVWSHDSPYVKILSIEKDEVLGIIIDLNRQVTNKYPLNVGDEIWFKKENIITLQSSNSSSINNLLTKERVLASGPLYTVESDDESDDDDESEYSTASESD